MKKKDAFRPDGDHAQRGKRKGWLRVALVVVLSVLLVTQGIPAQVIAEEATNTPAPVATNTNNSTPAPEDKTVPENNDANSTASEEKTDEKPAPDENDGDKDAVDDKSDDGSDKESDDKDTADEKSDGKDVTDGKSDEESDDKDAADGKTKDSGKKDEKDGKKDEQDKDGKKGEDEKDDKKGEDEKDDKKGEDEKDDKKDDKDEKDKDEEEKPTAIDFATIAKNGVIVVIHAPEGAFPAGTIPVVRPADASALMKASSDLVEGELVDARAVDICFMKNGAEVEPANGNSVSVSLRMVLPVAGETFSAVHLSDDGSTEVVGNNATMIGADFEANDFSVYGIVGGSVIRGNKEEYTRLKLVFRNGEQEGKDGAVLDTQIVHEGDQIVAPDPTPNIATQVRPDDPSAAVNYPTFDSWTVNGTAFDTAYFGRALTEADIQNFIKTYGATKSSGYDNLYEVTVLATYEDGYRAYFHRYSYRTGADSDSYNGVICGSLATKNKKVNLGDFSGQYTSPTETQVLTGWSVYDMQGKFKGSYSTTDTVTLSDDTDFYPVLAEGISVALNMNGAAALSDVVATYDSATKMNVLNLDDLPNATVSDANYYPGYTFGGWFTDSEFKNQITQDNPATYKSGTSNATVYAKWNPKENVSYKIAFLAEDEKGEPGQGNFTVYTTKTYTGKAGDKIPVSNYDNANIDYHHLLKTQDEVDGDTALTPEQKAKLNGYLTSNTTEDTTIEGDGSTIKLVYYTSNRIKFSCTKRQVDQTTTDDIPNFLPDKWVKPGESIVSWLGDGGFSNVSNYIYMGDSGKGYVQDEEDKYTFNAYQKFIPYVKSKSSDGTEISLIAHSGEVKSQVIGLHYYECIPGETSEVEALVNGVTRQFRLADTVVWWSFANANVDHVDETFGNTAEGEGLVERAYKSRDGSNGHVKDGPIVVRDIDEHEVGSPHKIGNADRYSKEGEKDNLYFDHYYVRVRGNLTFSNYDGVQAKKPQNIKDAVYGEKISKYLPDYTEGQTTREYGNIKYIFAGWYTDQVAANNPDDETSEHFKIDPDTATMPASDLALYAGWRIVTYTVTFDAMGGTFTGGASTLTQTVKSGERATRPEEDPTHAHDKDEQPYEFAGWYKDKECQNAWNFDTDVVYGDVTVYARWYHEQTWTLEYYRADNTEKPAWKDHFTEGSIVQLDAPDQATYNGKPFLGWALKVGEGTSDDDYRIVPNTFTIVGIEGQSEGNVIKLYARYGDMPLKGAPTVTFHSNYPKQKGDGKTSTALADPATPNGQITLPDYAKVGFTRPTNYKFIGWGINSKGFGTVYAAGEPVGVSGEPGENTDLYAIWEYEAEPKTATLTFDLAGGTLNGKTGKITMEAKVGDTVKLLAAPTRTGYTFKCWKGSEYAAGATYKVEGDHTFTAQWTKSSTPAFSTFKPVTTTRQNTLARTSDATSLAPMAALAFAGIATVAFGWRKRHRDQM